MLFSVIIPALNEEKYIATCLSCLVGQSLPKSQFEVILVDNGSTDRTPEIAESFRDRLTLSVLRKNGGTVGGLRNIGAAVARGEILAFLDSDCYAERDWLSLALHMAPAEKGIWGAHYRLTEDATWVSKTWNAYQACEVEGETSFIPSSNLFIRATAFRELRGFNEKVTTSEDVEICTRAQALGIAIVAHKVLSVRHADSPRSLSDFYRKNLWHGIDVLPNFIRNLPSTRYLGLVGLSLHTLVLFWMFGFSLFFVGHHPLWPIATLFALICPAIVLGLWKSRCRSAVAAIRLTILYETYFLARAAAIMRRSNRPHKDLSETADAIPCKTYTKSLHVFRESQTKESAKHVPALDGIRGFAALSVFILHYAGGTHRFMGWLSYLVEPINFGWAGVSLFFVLSGYLISGILWDTIGTSNWWRRFYWRRSLRIFPLYYLALLIAIGHSIGSHGLGSIFPGVLPYFAYLQNVPPIYPTLAKFPDAGSLSHFWSLAVEEQFYLIWPFVLAWLYPKADRARNVCLLVWLLSLAFRVAVFATGDGRLWAIAFLAGRAGELSLGAYLTLAVRDPILKQQLFRRARWMFSVSLLGVVAVVFGTRGAGVESIEMATIGIAINAILFASLIALSLQPGLVASVFETGWLRWLGRVSYGVYVYHILLGHTFDWIAWRIFPGAGRELHFLVLFFVAASGTLIVASLSYYFFELRFLRMRRHPSHTLGEVLSSA